MLNFQHVGAPVCCASAGSQVQGPDAAVVRSQAMSAKELPPPSIRILRLPEVCQVTGLKRAMIYRLQKLKSFLRV